MSYYSTYSDSNRFAPRIGPEAMPSPHPRSAPYFSGRAETFDDFLEEFEAQANNCELTGPQRVDALVHYVDSPFLSMCKSLNGYRSCDWHSFRQSLIHTFGSTLPPHRAKIQKLRNFVEDSSRTRMGREDEVLQYYSSFQHYSDPLVYSGHLTRKDRDIEFWYGFHPHDRDVLWPRLLALCPYQPLNVPFYYKDIFDCACSAFAYEERPSFRPREEEFEPRSSSRSYSDFHISSSFSPAPLPSEFQQAFAPSETEEQPEPSKHASPSCTDLVPKSDQESPNSIASTTLPVPSPETSCIDTVPEPETTPSITPMTPSLLPTTSLASSCTNIVLESKPESTSTTPTSPPLLTSSTHESSCSTNTVFEPGPELISEHVPLFLPLQQMSSTSKSSPTSLHGYSNAVDVLKIPSTPEPLISPGPSPSDLECHVQPEPEPPPEPELVMSPSPSELDQTERSSWPTDDVPEPQSERTSKSVELDQTERSPSLPLHPPHPFPAPVPSLSLSSSETLSRSSERSEVESSPASTIDHVPPLNASESSASASANSVSCRTIPHVPVPLESPIPSHHPTQDPTSPERTLGVTPHDVTPEVTSTPPTSAQPSHPFRSFACVPPPTFDR